MAFSKLLRKSLVRVFIPQLFVSRGLSLTGSRVFVVSLVQTSIKQPPSGNGDSRLTVKFLFVEIRCNRHLLLKLV